MKRAWILALVLALILTFLFASLVFAHEHRTIGKYEVEVGFLNEPAYTGAQNALYLEVIDTETKKSVEGLEKALKAEVIFGSKTMSLTLHPLGEKSNAYVAEFMPTKAGSYIFHLSGTIEQLKVDEKFESGPGRFSEVQEPTALQFPEKVPTGPDIATQLKATQTEAADTRTFAFIGIGLSVLGLIISAVTARRRQ